MHITNCVDFYELLRTLQSMKITKEGTFPRSDSIKSVHSSSFAIAVNNKLVATKLTLKSILQRIVHHLQRRHIRLSVFKEENNKAIENSLNKFIDNPPTLVKTYSEGFFTAYWTQTSSSTFHRQIPAPPNPDEDTHRSDESPQIESTSILVTALQIEEARNYEESGGNHIKWLILGHPWSCKISVSGIFQTQTRPDRSPENIMWDCRRKLKAWKVHKVSAFSKFWMN